MAGPGEIVPGLPATPGPQSNGGRPYGQDYRQVQQPAEVDMYGINRAAEAEESAANFRASELSRTFKTFEGGVNDIADKVETHAGALAGAASGNTGHPQYQQGLERFTAYGQAFNNAATGAYAVEAEAQADDAAARLRVEANNDPKTFATTYSAVRDAVLKTAPADAVPMLTELYNRHLAEGVAAVSGAQAQQQQDTQRATYQMGIDRQTSRVANLQGSANPQDQLRAQDEEVKLSLLIQGGVNSGLYSPAQAQALRIGAMRAVTEQVFQTQIDRELANPNGDALGVLQRFREAHLANLANTKEPVVLPESEFQKLMADGTTKVREQNMMERQIKLNGNTAEQQRYKAGEQLYTSQLFEGKLTVQALDDAVRSGDLKPSVGRSLRTQMLSGNNKSVPQAKWNAYHDPRLLDMTNQDIANLPGLSWNDKLTLSQHAQKERDGWNGTQNVKLARQAISDALKIPRGAETATLTTDQLRGLQDANQEYTTLMQGTDPAKRDSMAATIAQQVIKGVHQKQAMNVVDTQQAALQSYIEEYGPGSNNPADSKTYDTTTKAYEARITQALRAASGK
jgi:hypothetical protein